MVTSNCYVSTAGNFAAFDAAVASSFINVRGADGQVHLGNAAIGNPTTKIWMDSVGVMNLGANVSSTSPTTGSLVVAGGAGVSENVTVGSVLWVKGSSSVAQAPVATSLQVTFQGSTNQYGIGMRPQGDNTTLQIFYNAAGAQVGSITQTSSATAYNTSSDVRGKPHREFFDSNAARNVIDELEVYDFDKDGNSIRGIGLIAQQAYDVHKSFATPGNKPEDWWVVEKAAPMPFVIANIQLLNKEIAELKAQLRRPH